MVEESKSPKKVPFTEQDAATLLTRYSPETILTLLQEIYQNTNGSKIDWNALVKNTSTGITSAREYQTIWRHLAYGQNLCDEIEDDQNPLDDDSDLEIEREPFPAVSREAAAEAAACVKVLMASGCQNDPDVPGNSTIEAPLTISIPNIKALTPSGSSLHENGVPSMNITIPVFVQKQPLASGTSTGEKRPVAEPSSGVNLSSRGRKKPKQNSWSAEEETKLTAAVHKYGEQNWAIIASEEFNNDRKPTELSQKWSTLKKTKKLSNSKVGSNSQLSETQLAAAHRAMTMALDGGDNMKSASHVGIAGTKLPNHQPQKTSTSPHEHHQLGTGGRPSSVKAPPPPPTPVGPDPMIKAAALAAGARIATSAHAASLKEATRSQNIVHIKTGGGPVIKSPAAPITNQLPTNVHFIRDGLAKAPISAHAAGKPNITRSSGPSGSIKLADVPVKPVSQSDRGVDGGLSVRTQAEQKDQSAKPGNALEKI